MQYFFSKSFVEKCSSIWATKQCRRIFDRLDKENYIHYYNAVLPRFERSLWKMEKSSFFSRLFGKWIRGTGEIIASPITGEVLPIEEVEDATFARKVLGDGLAILPSEGKLYAPISGTVQGLQTQTGHALCLTTTSGVQLLLHIGRDTVKMGGRGFTVHCEEGQKVSKGKLLIEFDLAAIKEEGYDTVSPIIVLNTDEYEIEKVPCGLIAHGDVLYTLHKK
jgi:glucose-specific phosphotransferase system IIA component